MQGVWDMLKEKKRRSKGHSALGEAEENREPFFGHFVLVLERARNTEKKEFQLERCSPKR